jgi:formamidopyrimidine-DNA glycosylase
MLAARSSELGLTPPVHPLPGGVTPAGSVRALPELPEAERARALIEDRALGRLIVGVDDGDTYVCRPHAPGEIAAALTGHRFTSARRRGKSMWCETDGGPPLGIHLGMAGRVIVDGASAGDPVPPAEQAALGRAVAVDADRAAREALWARFALDFDDGGRLVLFDKRRLGRVVLDPDIDHLGPDILEVTAAEFRARVGRGTAPLKARLMDQGTLAGIGNLLADEILWQAGQPPLRPAGDLDTGELDALRRTVRATTRRAIRSGGVHTGAVIPHRRPGATCPRCGAEMVRAKVGGRTTWWCSREQDWSPSPV